MRAGLYYIHRLVSSPFPAPQFWRLGIKALPHLQVPDAQPDKLVQRRYSLNSQPRDTCETSALASEIQKRQRHM